MEAKHNCSSSIFGWSTACLVFGWIFLAASIIAWSLDGPGGEFLEAAGVAFICRPLLKGLSLLVRNAELQLAKDDDPE